MTTKTAEAPLTIESSLVKDVFSHLSTKDIEALLQQKQVQDGIDTLKAVAESKDPSDKTLQDLLIKKLFAFRRKNAPKKTSSGKTRGRKPGSKNAPKITTSAQAPSDAPASTGDAPAASDSVKV